MFLTREQILGAQDITKELVAVPEWGGDVYVKVLSGVERDLFESSIRDDNTGKTIRGAFRGAAAAASICDEDGNRLFTAQDMGALGMKSATALDRVIKVAMRISKIGEDEIEQTEKNSVSGQSDDSGLNSLSPLDEQ